MKNLKEFKIILKDYMMKYLASVANTRLQEFKKNFKKTVDNFKVTCYDIHKLKQQAKNKRILKFFKKLLKNA